MKTYEITLTSKNQITIPADVVRKLKLSKNRVLEMTVKEDIISLTPEQNITEMLRPYWTKHHAKKALTDDEIQQGLRSIAAKRGSR